MKQQTQKGFTLVELAIVMTIIGLLIGGILRGQELMENARITATINQVKAYEAAVTTFRDSYSALPGDMPNAQTRIPNCANNCQITIAQGAGNSVVGIATWTANWQTTAQIAATGMPNPPTTAQHETQLFWSHLLLADLIAGVTDAPVRAVTPPAWGETHPSARSGGGFVVGFGDGARGPGSIQTSAGVSGLILALTNAPATGLSTTAGQLPLTPARAAQIDRKIDDGRPGNGYVQGYGVAASCFGTVAASPEYQESITMRDCGLLFRIQG